MNIFKKLINKDNYKIQEWVIKEGYVGNFGKYDGPKISINKDGVFIDNEKQETFEIPSTLNMRIIYALGQAGIIEINESQSQKYSEFAKQLYLGKTK